MRCCSMILCCIEHHILFILANRQILTLHIGARLTEESNAHWGCVPFGLLFAWMRIQVYTAHCTYGACMEWRIPRVRI